MKTWLLTWLKRVAPQTGSRRPRRARLGRGRCRPVLESLEARLAPTIDLTVANASLQEGDTGSANMQFTVTRGGDTAGAFAVDFTTQDGTAVAGTDFTATSGTLVFNAGDLSKTVDVPVLGNTLLQANRSFDLAPSNPHQLPTFGPTTNVNTTVSSGSYGSAFGDLNGDGKPDLVVSSRQGNRVDVLLNTSIPGAATPTFVAAQQFAANAAPDSVVVQDVNGDGLADIVTGNELGDDVSVLINTTASLGGATVSFAAKQDFSIAPGSRPLSLAVADLNGDGLPDLVTANSGSNDLSVLVNTTAPLGTSAVTFAAAQVFSVGRFPDGVAVMDLNGDGLPDLVSADYNSADLGVLLNTTTLGTSTVSFSTAQTFSDGRQPAFVAAADLNGDGKPDLATANGGNGTASVFLNTTTPGATTPVFSGSQTFAVGGKPYSLSLADLDGDGVPDLSVADRTSNKIQTFVNATAPGAATVELVSLATLPTGNDPRRVSVADVNGDGLVDLAVPNYGAGTASVILNTTVPTPAPPSFAAAQTFGAGTQTVGVAAADLNGDGRPDLGVANYSSDNTSVLLNTASPGGTLSFGSAQNKGLGTSVLPYAIAQGDLNGDGKPDTVAALLGPDQVAVALNQTTPGSATATLSAYTNFSVAAGSDPESVVLADVNGDGKLDIVTANFNNSISILLNTTAAGAVVPSFAASVNKTSAGNSPIAVAVGDVNGDGRPDLLVALANSSALNVFLNTTAPGSGTASFAAAASIPVTGSTRQYAVALADVNGDGKLDIASVGVTSNVTVFLNGTAPGAATPTFDAGTAFNAGASASRALAFADVNADGKQDLLVGASAGLKVLDNTTAPGAATPTFASAVSFNVMGTRSLAVADFNGDGLSDLATATNGSFVRAVRNTFSRFTLPVTAATGTINDDDAPQTLTIVGGDGQSATINTAFTDPLVVEARNANNNLVQGVQVSFTPPGGSPSATLGTPSGTTDSSGQFSTTATADGTPGTYTVTATASGGAAQSTNFTLTNVLQPAITSANTTTFTLGRAGTFTVTTTGFPAPALSEAGALPAGVSFTDNGDGTATLTGTPTASGTFALTFTADNGVGGPAQQTFTLTVNAAPAFTSAAAATFTLGSAGTFTVTTTGFPTPALSETGTLPAGVSFTDNSDGTATLAGTPTASGAFALTFTADNGVGSPAQQTFTLTVLEAPAFTSAAAATFTLGQAGTFTVTTTGFPVPALTEAGTLPAGVSLTDNGDGTATLTGTPTARGALVRTLLGANGVGSPAQQTFTLTVNDAPAFTSSASATFVLGQAGTFSVTTTGFPTPGLSESGALPAGVTFTDNGDGTATLAGTPTTSGAFSLTLNTTSPAGSATQTFTLTVQAAPAITSAASTTFVVGQADTFVVTATGFPAPVLSLAPADTLPVGVTFTAATGKLSGTPAAGSGGTYVLHVTAANGVGSPAQQTFTLTVNEAPVFTSAAPPPSAVVGIPYQFTVTATGTPAPTPSAAGLPSWLSFDPSTGVLSGTPDAGDVGTTGTITLTAANGVSPEATQTFTITVSATGQAPTFTSATPPTAATVGTAYSFTVTATGTPAPTLIASGLPGWLTFDPATGQLAGTPAAQDAGTTAMITLTASNGVSPDAVQTVTLTAAARTVLISGSVPGAGGQVTAVDTATGDVLFSVRPFGAAWGGSVLTALGDVNGDGTHDVIAGAGPGGGPDVKVLDGRTGQVLNQFFAFGAAFTGGVSVAAGDVNGDGFADVIVGAGAGGGPNVMVVSGRDGALLQDFFLLASTFTGGVRVAAGDVDGDGRADLVLGSGPGDEPRVLVLRGTDLAVLRSFLAYGAGFRGGVMVAAGDLDGDGDSEVLTGAGAGGGPNVAAFGGTDDSFYRSFFAYEPEYTGGVYVAAQPGDAGRGVVVTGRGEAGATDLKAFDGLTLEEFDDFFANTPPDGGYFALT